jgi:uncharacterized membrane protein YfcA
MGEWFTYTLGTRQAAITPLKAIIAALMLVFAFFELIPRWRAITVDHRYLSLGGVLSGFFGGLSGHQGALRAAFLAKAGISATSFVGTSAMIGFLVDAARIITYAVMFTVDRRESVLALEQWPLIATGILAAFAGVLIGKRFLHKLTISLVQTITGILLLVIAVGIGSGLI